MIFKNYRFTLIVIFFSFFCVFFINNKNVYSWGLKSSIQKELDSNPFLKKENIKLKLLEEENGYLTIKMIEGNREIREAINEGADLNTLESYIGLWGGSKTLRKNFIALKKAINYIKTIDGVKEILLISSVNSPADLFQDGWKYMWQRKYKEAINKWTKSADSGLDRAQSVLSYMYWEGLGIKKDYNTAVHLAKKAAEQNYAHAQSQMAYYYFRGDGVKKDYASAIRWGKKAVEQGMGYDMLAWIYATATNEKYRDAEKSIKFAMKSISLKISQRTEGTLYPEDYSLFRVLAAAHAINNNFEKAVTEQKKSINLLKKHRILSQEKIQEYLFKENERLQAYMKKQVYFEN